MYRICKIFEIQAAHLLSKHPGKCKYPHGHSYRIEVVLESEQLDQNDMVCDFNALKICTEELLARLDRPSTQRRKWCTACLQTRTQKLLAESIIRFEMQLFA